jgi:hypothetical protein
MTVYCGLELTRVGKRGARDLVSQETAELLPAVHTAAQVMDGLADTGPDVQAALQRSSQ